MSYVQRSVLASIVLTTVVSCAAPVAPLVPPSPRSPASAPTPSTPSTPSTHATPIAAEASELASVALEGWLNPQIVKDGRGRVETLRFLEARRSVFVENDAGPKRISTFVAAHGVLFGYGALGAPGESFLANGEGSQRLAVVAYPNAERCPGLEVGLVYANADDNGTVVGLPSEWVVHCPDKNLPFLTIDAHVKTPGDWRQSVETARGNARDPVVAWLRERGFPEPTDYANGGGTKRLGFEGAHAEAADPLEVARTIAKKVVELEKLPPLDREVVGRERAKTKKPRVVTVRFSQTSPQLTARHIDPSVVVSFSVPYASGPPSPQSVNSITIDLEEEPPGPRPPADSARVLPSSFSASPEFLYHCTSSGGIAGGISSTLVDRRGDIYALNGMPMSFAEDDIRRALRRGKRYIATLDLADTDTLARASSHVARSTPGEEHVVADGVSTGCVFFRRTARSGVLEGIPQSPFRRPQDTVVLSKELIVVLNRMATLMERERPR